LAARLLGTFDEGFVFEVDSSLAPLSSSSSLLSLTFLPVLLVLLFALAFDLALAVARLAGARVFGLSSSDDSSLLCLAARFFAGAFFFLVFFDPSLPIYYHSTGLTSTNCTYKSNEIVGIT
jgi:hypothetical protein